MADGWRPKNLTPQKYTPTEITSSWIEINICQSRVVEIKLLRFKQG